MMELCFFIDRRTPKIFLYIHIHLCTYYIPVHTGIYLHKVCDDEVLTFFSFLFFKRRFSEGGCCELVLKIMGDMPESAVIQTTGCAAIRTLARSEENNLKFYIGGACERFVPVDGGGKGGMDILISCLCLLHLDVCMHVQ